MVNIFARIRRPALRQGLIFGLILGVSQVALNFVPNLGLGVVRAIVPLVFFIVFAFIAGRKAAQETGKLGTGVFAGLLTGVIGFLLVGLTTFIYNVAFLQQYINYRTTHPAPGVEPSTYTPSYVLTIFIINLLGGLLLYALIALIGGTIGGLLGRRHANASQNEVYKEAMFVPPSTD